LAHPVHKPTMAVKFPSVPACRA